jgi:hypothetical protein
MKTVELHLAYFWQCDDCGQENFCRSVVAQMSAEDRADMAEQGFAPGVAGDWQTRPDVVCCSLCGEKFKASDPFNEDEASV